MTEKELKEFLVANYSKEDEKCDWKEMKNLKNSFNGHEGEDVMSYVSDRKSSANDKVYRIRYDESSRKMAIRKSTILYCGK